MQLITRRELVVGLVATGAIAASPAMSEESSFASAVRAMSPMTGAELSPARVEPTSTLVGIIVDISKPLREIDLGEMEPATSYVAN